MSVSVIIKWGGQEYSISSLSEEDTVMDLKQSIKTLTGVLPERQKLLGLKLKGVCVCLCVVVIIQFNHQFIQFINFFSLLLAPRSFQVNLQKMR